MLGDGKQGDVHAKQPSIDCVFEDKRFSGNPDGAWLDKSSKLLNNFEIPNYEDRSPPVLQPGITSDAEGELSGSNLRPTLKFKERA